MNYNIWKASGEYIDLDYMEKYKGNLDEKDKTGCTPLYIASLQGNVEIVRYLISQGVNVNEKCIFGSIPLYIACVNNHYEVAELLLQNGSNIIAIRDDFYIDIKELITRFI